MRIARRAIRELSRLAALLISQLDVWFFSSAVLLGLTRHVCEGVTRCDARHAGHRACTHTHTHTQPRRTDGQTAERERERSGRLSHCVDPFAAALHLSASFPLPRQPAHLPTSGRAPWTGIGRLRWRQTDTHTDSSEQTPVSRPRQKADHAGPAGQQSSSNKQQQPQRTARHINQQ